MKISVNKFLDDCHPSTEWREKKIPESEKPVDGSFFLFPDVRNGTYDTKTDILRKNIIVICVIWLVIW